jgi:hypothetical protein
MSMISFGPTPRFIDGKNWFWTVTDHADQIYSSSRNIYVLPSDADYTTWTGKNNVAAPVASEPELWDVLKKYMPVPLPDYLFDGTTFVQPAANNLTAKQIKAYTAMVRWTKETGGIVFRTHPIITTREAQASINTTTAQGVQNPALTWNWKCADGTFWLIDVPTQKAMATAVGAFIDKCFTTEQQTITNPAITTTTQVNAAFGFSNVYT